MYDKYATKSNGTISVSQIVDNIGLQTKFQVLTKEPYHYTVLNIYFRVYATKNNSLGHQVKYLKIYHSAHHRLLTQSVLHP